MNVDEGFGSRIASVVKLYDSKKQAAEVAGLTTDSLARWRRGDAKPSFEPLYKLCAPKNISLDWLATGKGSRELGNQMVSAAVQGDSGQYNVSIFKSIPEYEVEASTGGGQLIDQEKIIGYIPFPEDWLKFRGYKIKDLAVISTRGDSMEPTITSGANILIDMSKTDPMAEGIYIIQLDGHLFAKRLQVDFKGGIYIKSDNPAYETQHLNAEEAKNLTIIGKVVWSGNEL